MPTESSSNWSRPRIATVLLCAFAGTIDSFDTQMIGFTARLIAVDLKFPDTMLGWLFGVGQLGGVIGAMMFGTLADRVGRKRILVVTCFLAACATMATLAADSLSTLLLYRFLAGIGLGGVLPCFLGLGVEAMPEHARIKLTPALYATFPLGGIIAGWFGAPLVNAYGWRGVFVAGAFGIACAGLMALTYPLANSNNDRQKIPLSDQANVSNLLKFGRAAITIPLWALFLLAPSGVYLLALWMPPLLQMLSISASRTSLLLAFLNLGALIVALGGGWVMVRMGAFRLIGALLFVGAFGFTAIVISRENFALLICASIVTGAALGGSMSLLVALAANAYPPQLRATGIGWALAMARSGQMSAPVPIGWLLARTSPSVALIACGIPVLLSVVPLILLGRAIKHNSAHQAPTPSNAVLKS